MIGRRLELVDISKEAERFVSREETSNASGEIGLFTRTSSVVMHPTKIGTVLIADGNGCKTVSAFIARPVLKDWRAILVSNVPSGTWVGVKKLPKGRGKGEGVGRRRLGASLLGNPETKMATSYSKRLISTI